MPPTVPLLAPSVATADAATPAEREPTASARAAAATAAHSWMHRVLLWGGRFAPDTRRRHDTLSAAISRVPILVAYSQAWADTNQNRCVDVERSLAHGLLGDPAVSAAVTVAGSSHMSASDVGVMLPDWIPSAFLRLAGLRGAASPALALER